MYNKTSTNLIQTTVLISPEFNELRKEHKITLSEAVRVGISVVLGEKGVREYNNSLNIVRQRDQLKIRLAEVLQKLSELENGR